MPPYTPEDEHYRFYRLYAIDLDGVKHSLRVLKRYRRADVRYCILREIIVSYVRPFSGNRGEHHKKHRLRERFVPAEHRALHNWLVSLRRQLLAHTDYTYHRPKVMKLTSSRGAVFPMSFKALDYQELERRLPAIERLVAAVESNLQLELRELETEG